MKFHTLRREYQIAEKEHDFEQSFRRGFGDLGGFLFGRQSSWLTGFATSVSASPRTDGNVGLLSGLEAAASAATAESESATTKSVDTNLADTASSADLAAGRNSTEPTSADVNSAAATPADTIPPDRSK